MTLPMFATARNPAAVETILISAVSRYILDALHDSSQRGQHREQCAQRLRLHKGTEQQQEQVKYADQAILANLDWGIDALDEAIQTPNAETKNARLEHAEKMLQVCALLDTSASTAGVPNSYLAAWAELNLAFVWKLRNDDRNASRHVLDMFLADPFYSRIDFAPGLWEHLFQPHLLGIMTWYSDQRAKLSTFSSSMTSSEGAFGESVDYSFSRDDFFSYSRDEVALKNVLSTVTPEQAAQLQVLEQLYQNSLDDHTRQYARYYKDWLTFGLDPSSPKQRRVPFMMPIAEPPLTPLHHSASLSRDDGLSFKRELEIIHEDDGDEGRYVLHLGRYDTDIHRNAQAGPSRGGELSRRTMLAEEVAVEKSPKQSKVIFLSKSSSFDRSAETSRQEVKAVGESSSKQRKPFSSSSSSLSRSGELSRLAEETVAESSPRQRKPCSRSSSFNRSGGELSTPLVLREQVVESSQKQKISSRPSSRSSSFDRSSEISRQMVVADLSPKLKKISRSASVDKSDRSRGPKKSKSFQRSNPNTNSKRLFEIFEEHNVQISSPRVKSSSSVSSSGYVTEAESDTEMKEKRLESDYRSNGSFERFTNEAEDDPEASAIEGMLSLYNQTDSSFTTYEEDFDGTKPEGLHKSGRIRPPKDFVCPITNQLFNDPVTLETGQTYERRAIQEWVDRGNTSCPITRQTLSSRCLPQTNYVLKRLVQSWKEQHPEHPNESPFYEPHSTSEVLNDINPDNEGREASPYSDASTSSSKVLTTQKEPLKGGHSEKIVDSWFIEGLLSELKPSLASLCVSEDLEECEQAVMSIATIWEKSQGDFKVEASLTKAGVIEGLIEVLSVSQSVKVHNAAISILSALVNSDEFTRHTIIRADPELEFIVRLVKRGLRQAVVLLYQLKLPVNQLSMLDLIPDLVNVITSDPDSCQDGILRPKTVAVILLEQLVSLSGNSESNYSNGHAVISLEAVPLLINNLGAKDIEERLSTVSILLFCMKADGRCRNLIARTAHLGHVVEVLVGGSDSARQLATMFFSELVQLNRRISNIEILKVLKDERMLSTMHVLLVYLHRAPLEQRHIAANLILQLELLDEPRGFSIYTEEAVEAIVAALKNRNSSQSQVEAAEALVALAGRFSYAGKPITEAWLLKTAGLDHSYNAFMNEDTQMVADDGCLQDEEKAATAWEFNVAKALLGYEQGAILEAVGIGLQSKNVELSKPSMITAVWLNRMVKLLPDIGLRPLARRCFLASFLVALESAKHSQQRALAALGLHAFLDDPDSFQELICYAKDIIKPLRQLKKITWISHDFIGAFIRNPSLNPTDIWQHGEIGQIDVSRSGEVRAFARSKGRIFSAHSDGSIQVWETKKKVPSFVVVLKEHTKAVTSLAISSSSSRLYSGSLDRTVRVWAIGPDSIHCMNMMDMKEGVIGVAISGSTLCVTTHNNGIKVHSEDFSTKQLNSSKHVQSLTMSNEKIYCGCTDNSIQEVDPQEGSAVTIQSGTRTLLGKKPIYAVQVFKNEIFTAGSPVEGAAVKIWDQTDNSLVRTMPTTVEIRAIAVNDDFLYLGSASGFIEVWLKERLVKVSVLGLGSKVNALLLDGDILYSGSEDGKIRAWSFV